MPALVTDPEVAALAEAVRVGMASGGGTRRTVDLIEAELPGVSVGRPIVRE